MSERTKRNVSAKAKIPCLWTLFKEKEEKRKGKKERKRREKGREEGKEEERRRLYFANLRF